MPQKASNVFRTFLVRENRKALCPWSETRSALESEKGSMECRPVDSSCENATGWFVDVESKR